MRMLWLLASALVSVGCVLGAARRATHAESASGPPPEPTDERTAQQLLDQNPRAAADADSRPAKTRPGHVWVDGYWHWDGVRHVWMPARWERVDPGDGAGAPAHPEGATAPQVRRAPQESRTEPSQR